MKPLTNTLYRIKTTVPDVCLLSGIRKCIPIHIFASFAPSDMQVGRGFRKLPTPSNFLRNQHD